MVLKPVGPIKNGQLPLVKLHLQCQRSFYVAEPVPRPRDANHFHGATDSHRFLLSLNLGIKTISLAMPPGPHRPNVMDYTAGPEHGATRILPLPS